MIARKTMKKKIDRKRLFASKIIILVIAIIFRITYCLRYPVPVRDSYRYFDHIETLQKTGTICDQGIYSPPLALYILGFPSKYWDCGIIKGGICIDVVLGLLIILVATEICAMIIPSLLIVFLISLIFSTHPNLVYYSCQCLRENSFILLSLLAIWASLLSIRKRSTPYLVLAGVFTAWAIQCRYEAMELLLFIPPAFILFDPQKSYFKRFFLCGLFFASILTTFFLTNTTLGIPLSYYVDSIKANRANPYSTCY